MSYQVLARKWRPRDFSQLLGQTHVVRALTNALDSDRVHHAFLFTGTRGVGKTTIARILAKCLNCEVGVSSKPCGECGSCREIDEGRFVDLLEVDAASRSKVDETRELMDNVQYVPTRGRFKVYLIDEVHMFSGHSFAALLKTLEEPPPHVKFLLATTDPQKLPVTVLSRCLQFNLKRLPKDQIAEYLSDMLTSEEVDVEAGAVKLIAVAADGSMRDALSLLDQAIAYGDGELRLEATRDMLGTLERSHLRHLLDALADRDGSALLACIATMAESAVDFSDALAEMISALHAIAIAQVVPESVDAEDQENEMAQAMAQRLSREDVQLFYQIGLASRRDLPLARDAREGFEMAMLRMLAFAPLELGPAQGGRNRGGGDPMQPPSAPDVAPVSWSVPCAPTNATVDGSIVATTWAELVAALHLSGLPRELASNCIVKEASVTELQLELRPEHEQLRGERIVEKLKLALEAHCGRPVRLRISCTKLDQETPMDQQQRLAAERHSQAVRSIEGDAGVQAICDTFAATIDKQRIRPID